MYCHFNNPKSTNNMHNITYITVLQINKESIIFIVAKII